MLTSQARETLRGRRDRDRRRGARGGGHQARRPPRRCRWSGSTSCSSEPAQRIGLSATVRPIEEVARFLGGSRPVEVVAPAVDEGVGPEVVVPVEDMTELGARRRRRVRRGPPPASAERRGSIWPHVEERVVDLIEQHRSTIVFANSRRLAERLTARSTRSPPSAPRSATPSPTPMPGRGRPAGPADGPGRAVVGRRDRRSPAPTTARSPRSSGPLIEDDLKRGRLPCVVATVEPRARHRHGRGRPRGADRVAAVGRVGAAARRPRRPPGRRGVARGAAAQAPRRPGARPPSPSSGCAPAAIEALRCRPTRSTSSPSTSWRRPRMDQWDVDDALRPRASQRAVRRRCPARRTTRRSTCSSGRYPTDEFAELRPAHRVGPRRRHADRPPGAQRLAVTSGGTIPDRGLFGVFLVGEKASRVGELDEEMVYESRVGDVFALGATRWRIEDITHDRVLVSPAPGQPGRLPFWKGDQLGPARRARRRRRRVHPRAGGARHRRGAGPRARGRARRLGGRQPGRVPARSSARPPRRCPSDRTAAGRAVPRRARRLADRRALALRRPRSTRRGRWRSARGCASATASTRRRCPPTTASCCASPRPTRSRPGAELVVFDARRDRGHRHHRGRRVGAVRVPVPRVRRSCPAAARGATRAAAPRCGSSGSAAPSCSRSPSSTRPSRSSSRRSASACRTSTTCRRCSA